MSYQIQLVNRDPPYCIDISLSTIQKNNYFSKPLSLKVTDDVTRFVTQKDRNLLLAKTNNSFNSLTTFQLPRSWTQLPFRHKKIETTIINLILINKRGKLKDEQNLCSWYFA